MLERLRQALTPRYDILREIGRGGSAVVYLAHDTELTREVAVKVLRPELSQSIWRDRFLQEITIEAKLQHPNILPIFETGEADGLLYYTMPYVEGESLGERMKREGELPVDDAVRITKEVAEALAHAHAHGVVHRDIKPGNILLSSDHALVADFGIARAFTAAGAQPLTRDTATLGTPTGVAVGTPEYMSPEQVAGDKTIDGRCDQYALACVLFEMLAGDPPFSGRSLQAVINRHISEPAPSLEHRREKAPPNITAAVDKALSKVAADRYPTMDAFVHALETPIAVRPRWWKSVAVAAAAAVVAAVGIAQVVLRDIELDANRIVVFPLRDLGGADAAAGHAVATTLGWVLEGTEPLRWVRGRDFMEPRQLQDPSLLSVSDAAGIARDRAAGHFVDGDILRQGDSVTVVLRLFSTGSEVPSRTAGASGPAGTAAPTLGARAMIDLVSEVVVPGRTIDRAGLSLRNPAAVTNFLLGETEYRQSHFQQALEHYSDAVQVDSMFSLAAIRGAQAANWLERGDVAELLTGAALRHDSLLPAHYAHFATGLARYFEGAADSAVARLGAALDTRAEWPEAWMALGEVYNHLLPDAAPLDSLAQHAFRRARALDPDFSAPLYHLTEIAFRRGEYVEADSLAGLLFAAQPDSSVRKPIEMMLSCRGGSSEPNEWRRAAQQDYGSVLEAAHTLASARDGHRCAADGLRAVLALDPEVFESSGDERRYKFAAKFALQSLMLAEERYGEVRALYREDPSGPYILWSDALEYEVFVPDVAGLVDSLSGVVYDGQPSIVLWLLGVWEARYGSSARALAIAEILRERGGAPDAASGDSLFGAIVTAHATLAAGDSLTALDLFGELRPIARRPSLGWGWYEPLGLERLALTRLLVARGDFAEAIDVASGFDSPQPISYLLYRPQSLELRVLAAEAIGDGRLAERCRAQLAAIRNGRGGG